MIKNDNCYQLQSSVPYLYIKWSICITSESHP